MLLQDRVTITGREATPEGYLRITARMARTGIQEYLGDELGIEDADAPNKRYRIWRPADEVFDREALGSFALKPVTDDHPPELLSTMNVKDYMVGHAGENVVRDENFVRVTLMITDAIAISKIAEGKVELSAGYTTDLDWTSGQTEDGESYDAVQRNIRGNHIALVDAGRCGGECRLDDQSFVGDCACASCQQKVTEMSGNTPDPNKKAMKTVQIDGLSVDLAEDAAALVQRLVAERDEARSTEKRISKDYWDREKRIQAELSAKDEELAKLRNITSAEAVAAACDARLDIMTRAMEYLPDEYNTKGKTNAQIARDAVSNALGADYVKDRDDAYVLAMFDTMGIEPAQGTTLGRALTSKQQVVQQMSGQEQYRQHLSDAWRNPGVLPNQQASSR